MTQARPGITREELRSLPLIVDIPTAGRVAFGMGRDTSYRLAREGRFPVPVLRLGSRRLRVTRASILEALGVSDG